MADFMIIRTGPTDHSVLLLMFRSFFFTPPNLWGRLADHHQTLPHVLRWPRFMKFGKTFGGPFPSKYSGPKTWNFQQPSRLDREFLRNATRYRQWENGFANCTNTPAQANLIWYTLVHTRLKTGPEFWPTGYSRRTGVNKSVAFARWRHWPTQRAAITLGIATHLVAYKELGVEICQMVF